MNSLEEKNRFSNIEKIIILTIIIIIGIAVRVFVFPFDLPIYQDGEMYFWYANDMSITKAFPESGSNSFTNTFWPILLSGFFTLFSSDNFIDYMELQRTVTVLFSVFTAIPIFFLCRKFVEDKYAIIGSCLFIFEPRLLLNSLNGLPEPLFIILGTIAIVLFLSTKMIWIYISFGILALFALTRYEGIVLIIPFSIMFFWRFREREKIVKYIICLSIFFIILFGMDYVRNEAYEESVGIAWHFSNAVIHYESPSKIVGEVCESNSIELCKAYQSSDSLLLSIFSNTTINLIKYYAWITIPLLVFFIPFGLFKIFKKMDFKKWTIIICAISMLIPAFYGFSRDFYELKYLYIQIPFLCVLATLGIEFLIEKTKKQKIITITLIPLIIFGGLIFFNEEITFDYKLEEEYFEIAKKIDAEMIVVNDIDPVDNYIRSARIASLEEFPVLRDSFELRTLKVIKLNEFESIEKLLKYGTKNDLEYLVVDQDGDGISYMHEIFINEKTYPFLEKIYDSTNYGFEYHVKFYKIDYEIVDEYYGYEL